VADANPSGPGRGSQKQSNPKNVTQRKQVKEYSPSVPLKDRGEGKDSNAPDPFNNPYRGEPRKVELIRPDGTKSGTIREDR
jgi:hypothetical protein